MARRPTLSLDARLDRGRQFLRSLPVVTRARRMNVITPTMRQRFAEAAAKVPHRPGEGIVALGEHASRKQGIEFGFYRDPKNVIHHVQDERAAIEQDIGTLRAADLGLTQLTDQRRNLMEQRIDLLHEFDAIQKRRMAGPQPLSVRRDLSV